MIAALWLVASMLTPPASAQAGWIYKESEAPVRAAIVESVQTRMGTSVVVTIGGLRIREALGNNVTATTTLNAVPDAGSKTGGFVRFVLFDSRAGGRSLGKRLGTADAEIFVAAEHVRAVRAIARGQVIAAEDVEATRDDVGRVSLKPLPGTGAAIGSKAVRAIAIGERIAPQMIAARVLVKSGDSVETIVRTGSMEARGSAVATQTGAFGAEIRLVNTSSRRPLRGRVVGAGEVEVMHEH